MQALDYYLLRAGSDVDGVLVEEFVRHRDGSTAGLRGALWRRTGWVGSSSFSRALRGDPSLLAAVVPASRRAAEEAFARLGGGALPGEEGLRDGFADYVPFATAAPLRLGPAAAPDGFHERRLYRVLFAGDVVGDGVSGRREVSGDLFSWTLRRVGNGLAWGLDVTVLLATSADDTVTPMLRELSTGVRGKGLVPVMTERFE
ncbi:hypothetical protein HH310_31795 [Actinoplanes sp. TBRC 11911]|uniref:hypothetical protein n=1 Tax=Actinoplanes sp. TBRC 11911 TaxID=2729386 RepID=UPI00145D816E|nr:hypothetical protein [Actinoplanes sp. TBRC 11911]NMO55753.1 hypothetical protein [Actinoplanes sp. TBRC 11911]